MGKATKWALALLCSAAAINAFAQDYETLEEVEGQSYVSLLPLAVEQDSERAINDDSGLGFRVIYGSLIKNDWYLEGQGAYNTIETGVGGSTDYYQAHLGLDFARRFGDAQGFRPFILIGGGMVYDDVFPIVAGGPEDDELSAFFNVGAGFVSRQMGRSGIHIRGEARYVMSQFHDGYEDLHYSIGLEIPLGRKEVVTRTQTKTVVKEKVVIKKVPVKAVDSDKDGVVDGVDRCPNTLAGGKVDQYGCVVKEQTIQLQGIFFETGSAALKGESVDAIRKLAEFMKSQPDVKVIVAGHTDSTGAAAYNEKLSRERADSVVQQLLREGVDPARMKSIGFGESQPLTSNETSAGRAMNRRVEFRIER